MGKKVKRTKTTEAQQVMQAQVEAPKTEAKVEGKATATAVVKALEFLRKLHLDWVLERNLEPGDLDALRAQVKAVGDEDGKEYTEWASWWMPYTRVDGAPVKGISWGISAPVAGGFIILRLVDNREAKAVLKVYGNGKGILTGSEPVVKALLARPDLPTWTDQDTAALL